MITNPHPQPPEIPLSPTVTLDLKIIIKSPTFKMVRNRGRINKSPRNAKISTTSQSSRNRGQMDNLANAKKPGEKIKKTT